MKYIVMQRAFFVGARVRKKSENMAENLELVSPVLPFLRSEPTRVLSEEQ